MKITPAIEDYLKVIYELTGHHGRASTTQIAEALDIKPASVTGMIKKLAATTPPLVDYKKHHGVTLTPDGKRAALEVTRHHRLLEQFLHEAMGFPWDEVHEEAHRLEHVISKNFVERMAVVLDHPRYDPHGAPIPTRNLEVPSTTSLCLGEVTLGQQATIKRVPDDDPALLRYLDEIGVVPGACFKVLEISTFDDNIKIQVDGQSNSVVLGPKITGEIFVEAA
jgi:DtxR family Mn-dependent transcriptional regulator